MPHGIRRRRRAHLGAVRMATVELGFHERHDVDAVDPHIVDVTADLHVDHRRAPDHDAGQIDQVEARVGEIDIVEPRAGQVDVLEPGAGQVRAREVSHRTIPSGSWLRREPTNRRDRVRTCSRSRSRSPNYYRPGPGSCRTWSCRRPSRIGDCRRADSAEGNSTAIHGAVQGGGSARMEMDGPAQAGA